MTSDVAGGDGAGNDPLLSICIPTYNRGDCLPDLLGSIAGQWDDRVEVVVSDNCSTDDTAAVLESWHGRIPVLRVVRQTENIGPDRNFLAVVAAARGTFCWLFGSDDIVEADGVSRVLDLLEAHPDITGATCNYHARDKSLRTVIRSEHGEELGRTRMLVGAEQVFSEIGQHLGFLSSQIVRRDAWMRAVASNPIDGFLNAYVHVYVIGRMLGATASWLVVGAPVSGWRSGNDSFLSNGALRRMEIDVVGYEAVSRALFGASSATYRVVRDRTANTHVLYALVAMRDHGRLDAATMRCALRLLSRHYARSPIFWRKLLPVLLVPQAAYALARRLRGGRRAV